MLVLDLYALESLLSDSQRSSAISFAIWIGIGLVVGFIASKILNKTAYRLRRDCLLGIVGAVVGGFLSNLIGKFSGSGLDIYSAFVAVVGAVVFMFVYYAVFRRRHFLSMK